MYNVLCGCLAGSTAFFMGSSAAWAIGTGVVVFVLWTLYDLIFVGLR